MTKDEAIKTLREDYCGNRIICELHPDKCNQEECEIWLAIKALETQPEVAKDTNVLNNDYISRKAVKYKLTALVNELEEIFSHIRERNVDDSVCGLCEYDGAYIGQSGDWCNECPGFDKDDCFKLKEKYREEWLKIDG